MSDLQDPRWTPVLHVMHPDPAGGCRPGPYRAGGLKLAARTSARGRTQRRGGAYAMRGLGSCLTRNDFQGIPHAGHLIEIRGMSVAADLRWARTVGDQLSRHPCSSLTPVAGVTSSTGSSVPRSRCRRSCRALW
jgi:hypothetical protein